jgi:cytochrome P450
MTETHIPPIDLADAVSDERFVRDPFATYARLRETPGWLAPSGYRVFSSYDDVQQILRQADVFGQERVPYPNFHTLDPPQHTRVRRLVAKAFTAHSIALLRDEIAAIVGRVIDDLEGRAQFDLVEDFALRQSAAVIAAVLQVPESDTAQWHRWLWDLARFRGVTRYHPIEASGDPGALDAARQANAAAAAYMKELITQRGRREPGGIVDGLFAAREADDSLSEEEVLYTLILLLGAGLHTTSGQLSNTFRAILSRPHVTEELRADPDLIPNAVEEALRYDGALQAEYRVVRIPTNLAGFDLDEGEHIIVVKGAVNHDPAVFTDPETFDVHRENARRHLTFGFGIHHCLGAELARTQLVTAMTELLRRFPTIELVNDGTQNGWDRWRGLTDLPVRVHR